MVLCPKWVLLLTEIFQYWPCLRNTSFIHVLQATIQQISFVFEVSFPWQLWHPKIVYPSLLFVFFLGGAVCDCTYVYKGYFCLLAFLLIIYIYIYTHTFFSLLLEIVFGCEDFFSLLQLFFIGHGISACVYACSSCPFIWTMMSTPHYSVFLCRFRLKCTIIKQVHKGRKRWKQKLQDMLLNRGAVCDSLQNVCVCVCVCVC